MRFLIVSAGWNCEKYIKDYFDGLKAQTYKNFKVCIIDDASTDKTKEEILKNIGDLEVHFSSNLKNEGGYVSYELSVELIDPKEYDVMCFAALDDKLLPNCLETVKAEYDKGMLTTYGTYINKNGFVFQDLHYPEEIHQTRSYRKVKFRCTALRTCRKELYFAVPKITQCEVERKIYYDLEFGFSLLEMAGKDRIGVITKPIYQYNNLRLDSCANLHGRDYVVYNKICSRPKMDLINIL